ncbi:Methanogenic corrinoid protein MtbC1 [Mariprofundus ferrinatatus]|uniref:Methanogenic corrinoid protein MtbC1 n=1 Tax=Mariprofundus ferrinatatus TaxID=1921087 RepID=A0A2K8L791_9PROT|nr:cobalamin-dependent protein [Mariprofundus ferrinatatus]ATX82119.1 Methanogenic corrinoid protein MtbC1 [Mariprofundus ferrinatatus]
MEVSLRFEQALADMDRVAAREIMMASANEQGALACVSNIVVPALEKIGLGWESGRYALAQIYMSGTICEELVDEILPPADPNRIKQPEMAIVVLEDFHVLGERIVYSTLRASGYELQEFGHGMHVDAVIEKVKQHGTKILLVSVLMLRSALLVGELVKRLKQEGLDVKVVVGGAPFRFDHNLWKEVGADASGKDGMEARDIISGMLGGMS